MSGKNTNGAIVGNVLDSHQQDIIKSLDKGNKLVDVGKAHLSRTWQLLSRRSIDVDKVMYHVCLAVKHAEEAQAIYKELIQTNPENLNVLRQFAFNLADDAAQGERQAIYIAECMNSIIDFSIYACFAAISFKVGDETSDYSSIFEIFNEQTYLNESIWHSHLVDFNFVTVKGTKDEMWNIERIVIDPQSLITLINCIQDIECEIIDVFYFAIYNEEKSGAQIDWGSLDGTDSKTLDVINKARLILIPLLFNVPFMATEEMKLDQHFLLLCKYTQFHKKEKENIEIVQKPDEENVDEASLVAQQRAEDVEEKLKNVSNIVPLHVKMRLFMGTMIIVTLVIPFFIVAIIGLSSLESKAGQITINEMRLVQVIQISATCTLYASGNIYPTSNIELIKETDKYSTNIFNSNLYITNTTILHDTVIKMLNVLSALTTRFQLGSNTDASTGDKLLDSFKIPRTQGKDSYIDSVMSDETMCLRADPDDCEPVHYVPGLQYPFQGLGALLTKLYQSVTDLMAKYSDDIDYHDETFNFVVDIGLYDLRGGLQMIGNYLMNGLNNYTNTISSLLLGLFIGISILILIMSFIFFLPLPSELRSVSTTTSKIIELAHVKRQDCVVWNDDFITNIPRIDKAHMALFDKLTEVLHSIIGKEKNAKIQQNLDVVITYACIEFADEEQMMETHNFPTSMRTHHSKAHATLIKKMLNFQDQAMITRPNPTDALMFLSTWISQHIKTNDQELGLFLSQKAKKEKLEQEIDMTQFIIPISVNEFYNGPDVNFLESQSFENAINRIQRSNQET
ncbi:MAG: hypothetical protein EZS28_011678 [Streblomastix strix]|uniref:Hemerythrin-like domain-containing protein n=1 Tax=Streblomastix strix TaxID=222440 RepID=A0A5J4WCX2_9EUKA|nr:MAG: hypothetical protein EZS28_011678 [Streblomastix strix]